MIRKILLAYDGSDNGRRALDVASELAAKLEADLYIVHVLMHGHPAEEMVRMAEVEHIAEHVQRAVTPPPTYATAGAFELFSASEDSLGAMRVTAALGDQLLAYARSFAEEQGAQNVQTATRNGDYADQILDAAEAQEADLIVLGSRGLGKIRGAVMGSVSQKVLHHAAQTVVAVK